MKRIFRLLLILWMLAAVVPANAQPALRIATEGAYPPFNIVNEDGTLTGFDVDIALALCEAMDRQCAIEALTWDDLIPALQEGRVDAVVASMAKTPERTKLVLFTDYYYRSRASFMSDPTKGVAINENGLKGKTVATQANTVQENYLRKNFGAIAKIVTTKTIGESFELLVEDQADVVLSDSLIIYEFLQTKAGKRFDFIGAPLPAGDPSSEAYIAVRKKDHELAAALNKALKLIRLSGEYGRINRHYFPFSIY